MSPLKIGAGTNPISPSCGDESIENPRLSWPTPIRSQGHTFLAGRFLLAGCPRCWQNPAQALALVREAAITDSLVSGCAAAVAVLPSRQPASPPAPIAISCDDAGSARPARNTHARPAHRAVSGPCQVAAAGGVATIRTRPGIHPHRTALDRLRRC